MAPLRFLLAGALLFLSAHAHFELIRPRPLEGDNFSEDKEGNAPCGGGVPDLSQNPTTDFHVGGDSVAVLLGHAQANWLIRATLDSRAAGNWTQLFPMVTQSGRGNFCEPAVTAPKEWAGKKGIIGVACGAPDGLLFQCAAVNFVSGANTAAGASTCTNGSAVSASFHDDPTLASLLGGASSTTAPGSTTAPSPSATKSGNAAPSLLVPGSGMPIGSLAVTAFMLLVGAAVV